MVPGQRLVSAGIKPILCICVYTVCVYMCVLSGITSPPLTFCCVFSVSVLDVKQQHEKAEADQRGDGAQQQEVVASLALDQLQ